MKYELNGMTFLPPLSDATYSKSDPTWLALSRCAMLCNRAEFKNEPENLKQPVLKR